MGWDDQLTFGDGRAVEPSGGAGDGKAGELVDVLRDGGECDVRQAGQAAVVEPDDEYVTGDVNTGAAQDIENAGRTAVVEHRDGGRQGVSLEQGASRSGSIVLGETAGQDEGGVGQAVPLEGFAVAASAFGGARSAAAVDVDDAGVAERDKVVDGQPESGGVVSADHVDGAVPHRAGDDDKGHAGGEFGQVGRWYMGAEQDQRLAAILQQARDGAALIAAGSNGAKREFVVGGIGGSVEAADEVAVESVLHVERHAYQPVRVLRWSRARLSGR